MFRLLGWVPLRVQLPAMVVVLLGSVVVVVVAAMCGVNSAVLSDLRYQCDSAIGPESKTAVSPRSVLSQGDGDGGGGHFERPSGLPMTNPYAEQTIPQSGPYVSSWLRDCLTAMRFAPYQAPALQTPAVGIGVACARRIALQLVGQVLTADAGGDLPGDRALPRYLAYHASVAEVSGRCDVPDDPDDAWAMTGVPDPIREPCANPLSQGTAPTVVVLPDTIAAQGMCGQRVEYTATSAGDLVFWDYRDNAPTQVGVAVESTSMVTMDSATNRVVQLPLPWGTDVRVKRVLPSDAT
ncbi:hypothetical protein [Nocardia sp. NPDC050793]|uniref:hypothetical protein n=1 Tax=Nocardia sp. NPDC050793 TaxID=3155159 RepID=UPI0033C36BB1